MSPIKDNILFIISGPAGVGKTTLCDAMLASYPNMKRVVTATSRKPREGEAHERDYYFLTREHFLKKIQHDAFYEYANVHGNLYGVLKHEIDNKLNAGFDLLINIDVQGAASFAKFARQEPTLSERLVSVFIAPQNIDELRQRLERRDADSKADIEKRLKNAQKEISQKSNFDHLMISSEREHDFIQLKKIYLAEKAQRKINQERK